MTQTSVDAPRVHRPFMAQPELTQASSLLQLLRAAEAWKLPELLRPPLVMQIPEQSVVQLEGAPVLSIHVVRSGSFKCARMLEDGYEQVLSFAERGEVLGFEGLCSGYHATTATALEHSTVYVLPVAELDSLVLQSPRIDRALRGAVSRELIDAGRTTDMIAAVSSDTRLARFLVWCSDRAAERGESPRRLRLRMCRRDLASFIGVAHETVSRCFTMFVRQGVLSVRNRDIEILDAAALKACSRGTRRGTEGGAAAPQAAAATGEAGPGQDELLARA